MNSPPISATPPNPYAPTFRPSPARAATLSAGLSFKSRATSQPAGDRTSAVSSYPEPGRGSSGNGSGGAFGVIGGSRTPARHGNVLGTGGVATRANSFSAGEHWERRNSSLTRTISRALSSHVEEHPFRSHSTSPFPTFSTNSSPPNSPSNVLTNPLPLAHSPPKAGANVSRSRSQSLAAGHRPGTDRGFGPMSTLDKNGETSNLEHGLDISLPDTSNMSPFTRGVPTLEPSSRNGGTPISHSQLRSRTDKVLGGRMGMWGSSMPERVATSTLTSSVARALGGQNQPTSTVVGGFGGESNVNGGKSGSSSRRHSVSVVGGPGGRRDFAGQGMTSMTSPPGRGVGPLGFTDIELLPETLGNALSLEIDQSRRRGVEIEVGRTARQDIPRASNFPTFEPLNDAGRQRTHTYPGERESALFEESRLNAYSPSPARGRGLQQPGLPSEIPPSIADNVAIGQSKYGVGNRLVPDNMTKSGSTFGGLQRSPSPDQDRDLYDVRPVGTAMRSGPGPIGGPLISDPRFSFGNPPHHVHQMQMYPPGRPISFPDGAMGHGIPSPVLSTHPMLGRHPPAYGGSYASSHIAPRPAMGGALPAGTPFSPASAPPSYQPSFFPPNPALSHIPISPSSFSSLSLADLGKGLPLTALPPNTPLYVVTFKASRRDVYYCPDPTLLISTGDRVIVEADRGSDLGTIVYDQFTPIDVREWQEKQATAALLSGASQHQPPGMAIAAKTIKAKPNVSALGGELAGADLDTLLAGVGPTGQLESGQTQARGPLAKEVMPKRIFAKSSQGPEEQARIMDKMKDEYEALMICREKVLQRGLPMQVVDAEYQWDRRKLTFYFKAEKRVDFRDLTKENFRIFKSRIWMSMVPRDDPRG